MSIWTVEGGIPLRGSIRVQGSKNAVLPILAASILTPCVSILENCPVLSDVEASVSILRCLGCKVIAEGNTVIVDSRPKLCCCIPSSLMGAMRSSVLFMGALLGRNGEVHASLPGGCELGARPIDYHLAAFKALGAEVRQDCERISCQCRELRGCAVVFPGKSVGATENALLAACCAVGETLIVNAAAEPEIVTLCEYLRSSGALITGDGTDTIRVSGMRKRRTVHFRIPGDRIAACSYLCFAAASRGQIRLYDCPWEEISPVLSALKSLGVGLRLSDEWLEINAAEGIAGDITVCTEPYPGFPTDAAPLLMAVCCGSRGQSFFKETIFSDRMRYVPALMTMGADIEMQRSSALVRGVESLKGAKIIGTDLRGSAALLCAALGAEGESVLSDAFYLERGYESLEDNLHSLGAHIKKE